MTIKEATLSVMSSIGDEPVRQVDIVKKVSEMTGYSYESCRANSFRNPNAIPEMWLNYKKVVNTCGYVSYKRQESKYEQNYKKPEEYYQMLYQLNDSDKIFTLCGTSSHCMKVLDANKTIKVDKSPHTKPDLKKDIHTIFEKASYNLDYEGILTEKKVSYINKVPADKIHLTIRSSKNDYLLNEIKGYQIVDKYEYMSGRDKMRGYLFSKCHNLTGDSSNM